MSHTSHRHTSHIESLTQTTPGSIRAHTTALLPSEETSGYAKIIVDYACDTVGGQRLDGQDPHRQRMRWRIPNPRGRKVADVGSNLFHYPRAELSRPHAARARVSVCDAETYRSGALTDQLKHRSKTLPAHHSQRARQSVS
jgi:hypothetical protein